MKRTDKNLLPHLIQDCIIAEKSPLPPDKMGGAPKIFCLNANTCPHLTKCPPSNAIEQLANTDGAQIMRQGQIVADAAQTRG